MTLRPRLISLGQLTITLISSVILSAPLFAHASGDLVGYWKFDEGSGTSATDSSGNGWTGTITNATYSATTPDVEFANPYSVYFNPATSGRIVSTSLSLNNYTQFTMAGWMYPTAATDRASLFGQNDIFEFGFTDADTIFCYTSKGEVSWDFNPGTFLNNWHHITCLATASELIMYIDGVNRASTNIGAGSFGSSGSTFTIGAGAVDGGNQGPFSGYIDDVRVYSRGLTPSEMEGLGSGESGPTNNPSIESTTPADNATGVALDANLSFTFATTTMATSTGSIGIYKTADDSLVESFSVTSPLITRNVTGTSTTYVIDPSVTFAESTGYYVYIASTTFKDSLDAFYEGTASTTWNFTTGDFSTPALSSITASSTASTSADVAWSTDEEASTKVIFGVSSEYGSTTPEYDTSPRVTSHYLTLSPLLPCTTYHYAVVSRDAGGNSATSSDATFLTTGCEYDDTPVASETGTVTSGTTATTSATYGGKTFSVAATATSTSLTIQIRAIPNENILASYGRPSASPEEVGLTVFDVKAIIDGTIELDSFDVPVTISYEYTDEEISGLNESTLKLYHYHNSAWEELDDCSIDQGANTISCTTDSFSIFGLFGTASASASQSRRSSATRFGCKDQNASNYEYFSRHKQELCTYETPQIVEDSGGFCAHYNFSRRLQFGSEGEDVRALQKFLNCTGFILAETGPGSRGNETMYFVEKTKASLIRFQEAFFTDILAPINAQRGTGIFGEYSRKKAETLMTPSPVL